MTTTSLRNIWGTKETRQSALIAQTLAYCPDFRSEFLNAIKVAGGSRVHNLIEEQLSRGHHEVQVETERWLDAGDRIDLFVRFGSNLVLGIENKIGAALRQAQLTSYWKSLQKLSDESIVVLLAPSTFTLDEHEIPESDRFVRISYATMSECARACSASQNAGFSPSYFLDLAQIWEEFDLTPLNNEDIAILKHEGQVQRSVSKLTAILAGFGGSIEHNKGRYVLTRELRNQELPLFVGVRHGTNWYYSAPLLDGKPEAIAYLKEEKLLSNRSDEVNAKLRAWVEANQSAIEEALKCKLDYYPRQGPNECRLALRRSLDTLVNTSDDLPNWLRQAQSQLMSITL